MKEPWKRNSYGPPNVTPMVWPAQPPRILSRNTSLLRVMVLAAAAFALLPCCACACPEKQRPVMNKADAIFFKSPCGICLRSIAENLCVKEKYNRLIKKGVYHC